MQVRRSAALGFVLGQVAMGACVGDPPELKSDVTAERADTGPETPVKPAKDGGSGRDRRDDTSVDAAVEDAAEESDAAASAGRGGAGAGGRGGSGGASGASGANAGSAGMSTANTAGSAGAASSGGGECPIKVNEDACSDCFRAQCATSCDECAADSECGPALQCTLACEAGGCSACTAGLPDEDLAKLRDFAICLTETCSVQCNPQPKGLIGDPCTSDSDCEAGSCAASWCTTPCSSGTACGINSFGNTNVCAPNVLGDRLCFPGCKSVDDCARFAHTDCFVGPEVSFCATPVSAGGVVYPTLKCATCAESSCSSEDAACGQDASCSTFASCICSSDNCDNCRTELPLASEETVIAWQGCISDQCGSGCIVR